MVRVNRKIRKWLATTLDLPQDVALDLPRVTMLGDMQTVIENYGEVIHFTSENLKLRINDGELEVIGKGLIIRNIATEEVFIEGKITGILIHKA